MHVEFTKNIYSADGEIIYRAGEREHVPTSVWENLRFNKQAVEVKRASYGTPEYLKQKQDEEARRVAALPDDQRQKVSTTPTWTVRKTITGKVVVGYEFQGTSMVYGEVMLVDPKTQQPDPRASERQIVDVLKAAKCPQSVIDQFLATKNSPDALAADAARLEADRRAQAVQRERERNAVKFI